MSLPPPVDDDSPAIARPVTVQKAVPLGVVRYVKMNVVGPDALLPGKLYCQAADRTMSFYVKPSQLMTAEEVAKEIR